MAITKSQLYSTIWKGCDISSRVNTVTDRYAETLSSTTQQVSNIESKVLRSLEETEVTL